MAQVRRTDDGQPLSQLRVELHVAGEVATDVWCPTCCDNCATTVEFVVADRSSLVAFGRGTASRCYRCGNPVANPTT